MEDRDHLKEILLRVQAGDRNFAPTLSSLEAITHFQPTAHKLKTALDLWLITQAHFVISKRRETHNNIVSRA